MKTKYCNQIVINKSVTICFKSLRYTNHFFRPLKLPQERPVFLDDKHGSIIQCHEKY